MPCWLCCAADFWTAHSRHKMIRTTRVLLRRPSTTNDRGLCRRKWRDNLLHERRPWATTSRSARRTAAVTRLHTPTLIVVGNHDECDPDLSEEMHSKIPNSQLVVLPKSGHMTVVDQPMLFNRTADSFIHGASSNRSGATRPLPTAASHGGS